MELQLLPITLLIADNIPKGQFFSSCKNAKSPSFIGDGAKCYTSLATDHKWNENGASVTCRLHESLDLNIGLRLDFGLFVNLDLGLNFSIK